MIFCAETLEAVDSLCQDGEPVSDVFNWESDVEVPFRMHIEDYPVAFKHYCDTLRQIGESP